MAATFLFHLHGKREPAGAAGAGALRKLRAAQAAAGREQRQRLEEIGLAGAVLAAQDDQAAVDGQIEPRVGTEILQHDAAHQRGAASRE